MALPTVEDAQYPSAPDVRDSILRAIRFAYARRGLDANVLPGSDHYIRAQAYGARVAIAIANNELALQDSDPLTATGDGLVTLAGVFGVSRRPAGSAGGGVRISCAGTVSIPAGFQCTAPNGKKYQTVTAATAVPSGTILQVIATTGGTETNQAAGTKVTWDSASIGALSSTATVDDSGLTGGTPEDTDETLRGRLLDRLANPPVGGNASEIKLWAEESTSSVEVAYVYPAVRGPASYDVAVTKAGGDRTLPPATLAAVRAFVLGKMPGQQSGNFTSVTTQEIDVILEAVLPFPSSVGGVGGGWRDGTPWPSGEAVKVTAYNSGTGVATVNSTASPVVGQAIGVWDSAAGVMREYAISSDPLDLGGSTGMWTFKVQGDFIATPLHAYVSAGAVSLVQYASAFAARMALLGPGEKTTSQEILPIGFRFPSTQASNPTSMTSLLLAAVTTQYSEIADLAYLETYDNGTTTTRTSPDVPLTTADPPNILVLKEFAIVQKAP